MTLFVIAGSIFGGLAFASLSEYLMHRIYLHSGKSNAHTITHHELYKGASFSDPAADPSTIKSSWQYIGLCLLVAYLPGLLLLPFVKISLYILTCVLYFIWSEYVHLLFHKPSHNWIENTKEFNYLRDRHFRHHNVPASDYGIGTSLWDKVLGTENRLAENK